MKITIEVSDREDGGVDVEVSKNYKDGSEIGTGTTAERMVSSMFIVLEKIRGIVNERGREG